MVPKPGTLPFTVGSPYTRPQIAKSLGTSEDTTKGDWATGYHLHSDGEAEINGWWFLFPTIGQAGRTGHDYVNKWISDTELKWEGKTQSRLGQPQIDSLISGDKPVLLFSREGNRKPFKYHGLATAAEIRDTGPVTVVWRIAATSDTTLEDELEHDDNEEDYQPNNEDHRERVIREIRARRGQGQFRNNLLRAFKFCCAVSGCDIEGILEAAHINPCRGMKDNHVSNGLLLRCDLHTLFDLDLLGIEPSTHKVCLNPSIQKTPYIEFEGIQLKLIEPLREQALLYRWQFFLKKRG